MRHRKRINQLGRTNTHRGAMLSNMASSLIMHKRIFTTVPKAKALRKVVEPLITKSKEDTTHSRRMVFRTLQNKESLTELFQNVSQKVGDRPGGYTRIIKTGHRSGDNAAMCFIELVDYNENMLKDAAPKKTRRTRRSRRRRSTDAATTTLASDQQTEAKEEKIDKAKTENTVKSEKDKAETSPDKAVSDDKQVKEVATNEAEETKNKEKKDDVKDEPKKEER